MHKHVAVIGVFSFLFTIAACSDDKKENPDDANVAPGVDATISVDTNVAPGVDATIPVDAPVPDAPQTDAPDEGDGPTVSPESDTAMVHVDGTVCPQFPNDPTVDTTGTPLWTWTFDWRVAGLAAICKSYGDDAKMVLEIQDIRVPADHGACTNAEVLGQGSRTCTMANHRRYEAASCADGVASFTLPTEDYVSGYYHIEGSAVPNAARREVYGGEGCPRQINTTTGPVVSAQALAAWELPAFATNLLTTEPAYHGQPCQVDGDCPKPSNQRCFIDDMATAGTCPTTVVGRCVPRGVGNCIIYPGCACLRFFGSICGSEPDYTCGYPTKSGPCAACVPRGDAGL